jgi:DNA replication protein DnaC
MKTLEGVLKMDMPTREDVCEKHGVYESKNYFGSIWSKCLKCGEERAEVERQQVELEMRKQKRERWESKLGAAAIPERFRDRTLDTYIAKTPEQEKALSFARDYALTFNDVMKTGRSALFIGKPGTGKTHLAVGIALRIMGAENRSALFTTVQRAIRRVKDTWTKESSETESQAIAALAYPDLLILDEVGVQFGSEFEKQVLFDVLNDRYEKRKPVILLSNLDAKEVAGYLGERIADRLREDGGKVIVFNWESHRKQKQ